MITLEGEVIVRADIGNRRQECLEGRVSDVLAQGVAEYLPVLCLRRPAMAGCPSFEGQHQLFADVANDQLLDVITSLLSMITSTTKTFHRD